MSYTITDQDGEVATLTTTVYQDDSGRFVVDTPSGPMTPPLITLLDIGDVLEIRTLVPVAFNNVIFSMKKNGSLLRYEG